MIEPKIGVSRLRVGGRTILAIHPSRPIETLTGSEPAGRAACLRCHGEVEPGAAEWRCSACGWRYPATLGIPDFRPDPTGNLGADIERLVAAYPSSRFDDLLSIRMQNFSTDHAALLERYVDYRRNMTARGEAFYAMAKKSIASHWTMPSHDLALVIGCGAGTGMMAVARDFVRVYGIDPSLGDLILAKKAAEELGLVNVTLIQGLAQHVPLQEGTVDFAIAQDVLEHVGDLDGAMKETGRVLRRGGAFAGNSVNRYNALRPEPHVKLWFLGYLPRTWQAPYAKWRRNFDGYDRSVRLPSLGELRRALRDGIGTDSVVTFPSVAAYGFSAKLDGILRRIEKVPLVSTMCLSIFPAHLALGSR
jgi:ubiquinone/menaquinone biosynthesis C-methylase UbiE